MQHFTKEQARRWARQQRHRLDEISYKRLNEALFLRLVSLFCWDRLHSLHTFLPIIERREPDTWQLVHWLWQHHPQLQIWVPRVHGQQLEHSQLLPGIELQNSQWGVPEPALGAKPILATPPDLVLVPLLACDKQGNRVGYGKGFYDRFLAQLPHTTLRLGLSFWAPLPAFHDIEEHDEPLHLLATPAGVYDFRTAEQKAMHVHLLAKQNSAP